MFKINFKIHNMYFKVYFLNMLSDNYYYVSSFCCYPHYEMSKIEQVSYFEHFT